MKIDGCLLDTNILIYISNRESKYLELLENIKDKDLYISIISYIEYTIYPEADLKILDYINVISLDKGISDKATEILRSSNKKTTRNPKFSDIVIGATAEVLGIPLITNNPKDFQIFDNLKITSV